MFNLSYEISEALLFFHFCGAVLVCFQGLRSAPGGSERGRTPKAATQQARARQQLARPTCGRGPDQRHQLGVAAHTTGKTHICPQPLVPITVSAGTNVPI